MAFFFDRFISNRIRELRYDVKTQTLAVVFPDKTVYHRPVPYPVYSAIFHAKFPAQLYRETVKTSVPVVQA